MSILNWLLSFLPSIGRFALPIGVLILVMLLLWPLVLLLEFLVERILPTKFYYWLLASFAAALVAIGWAIYHIADSNNTRLGWLTAIFGLLVGSFGYFRLLEETGCPHCNSWLPFRRREMDRQNRGKEEKRSTSLQRYSRPYVSTRKPYFRLERSWDETVVRVYQNYSVRYHCAGCGYEWETKATKMLTKYEEQRDLPPETYRDSANLLP
jgi:hypothetical protein